MGKLIFYQGASEPDTRELLLRLFRPGMVVLDVGANVGEYTLLAARSVGPNGKVYAFEPNASLCPLLERNVRENGLENVVVSRFAVSAVDGHSGFMARADPALSSLVHGLETGSGDGSVINTYRVPTVSIDSFVRSNEITVNLVKIDVEGAEGLVLDGGRQILDQPPETAPFIVMEFSPANLEQFGETPISLLARLWRNNYQVWRIGEVGTLTPVPRGQLPESGCNLAAAKNSEIGAQFLAAP